jgi:SAM-dependent methyltransferase
VFIEHDGLTALDHLGRILERAWVPPPSGPTEDPPERFYNWIPLPLTAYLDGMNVIGAPAGRSLLEIGCGIGSKLLLARLLGWDRLTGLELRREYVEVARELTIWAGDNCRIEPGPPLLVGDAFEFDRYDEYDVVYMYRPCIEDEHEAALERLIASRMRPGAVAFFAQGVVPLGEPLGRDVWRISHESTS